MKNLTFDVMLLRILYSNIEIDDKLGCFWWVLDEFDGKADLNLENLKIYCKFYCEFLQQKYKSYNLNLKLWIRSPIEESHLKFSRIYDKKNEIEKFKD